jgi:Xaa-Pro aminopeptidase
VLAAQQAAFDAIVPGRTFHGAHDAAVKVLAQGMLDTGLLDRNTAGTLDDVIANKAYTAFYMHGTSHWLGMDVHDTGAYRDTALPDKPSRALVEGMVLTVEPGIYVRPGPGVPERYWHIGIRIEDDVVVTANGPRVLTDDVPKAVADIERLIRQGA